MIKQGPIVSALSAALILTSPTVRADEEATTSGQRTPNIILIVADDLGYGELGCYGQEWIKTPHIDRLAAEGIRFTQFYSGSPVCAPSRCMLLTGKHSGHAYIRDNANPKGLERLRKKMGWEFPGQHPIPDSEVTMAELLKRQGYATAAAGKWGLGHFGTSGDPTKQGFDLFYGFNCQVHAHNHYPRFLWRNDAKEKLPGNDRTLHGETYSQDKFTEVALEFIRDNQDRPFFLYLPFAIPHLSIQVPGQSLEQYRDKIPEADYRHRGYLQHPHPRAGYAAMISHMDRDVGKIMDLVASLALDDNTIILFTSDNGPTYDRLGGSDSKFFDSSAPLRGRKGSVLEGGLRVPLVARWPGRIEPGCETDHIAAFWDLLPTFCDLAGAPAPADIDGISMAPTLLESGQQAQHAYLYWEFPSYGGQQAIRLGDWKAVRQNIFKGNMEIALYNLAEDVAEEHNLAGEHPELIDKLANLLDEAHTPSKLFPLLADERQKRQQARPPAAAEKSTKAAQRPRQRRPTWRGGGQMIPDVPRDEIICFALYTVHNKVLKLTAQFYPLEENEERQATLQIQGTNGWKSVAKSPIDTKGFMAAFRIEDWDDSQNVPYRVTHAGGATYEGLIRKNPRDKDEIVVAAFTGNSNSDRGPRTDIIANVKAQDPDLLFFSGDQSYDHRFHTAAWLLFGRQFGEIIKDRPTICIPDNHDVGQGNLWGEGGKVSTLPGGSDGGYVMPADYVNMVQRAQTSHLPDPFDATPIDQGITVYYTSLNVGGIDFAIVEDRKFKTGPAGLIPNQGPRPDHVTNADFDPRSVDVPEASLLGRRQLKFLRQWGQDWTDAEMKAVLSQTIFAGGAHLHGKINGRLVADFDANGWPQSGRARALRLLRKCFAFHLAGDQHLATVIHHGVNSWEDSIYSFCVPSIVNYYGRWWHPLEDPLNHDPNNPLPFTGRYYDGFRNKLTMHAYANPAEGNHNAAGHGIVRFKKSSREITLECWPRHVDVTAPDARQFPGWPITIHQEDNYSRPAVAWLPTLEFAHPDPVVQVIDASSDRIVYTLRARGDSWRPKVFKEGDYTIHVTGAGETQTFDNIKSGPKEDDRVIEVRL